MPGDCNEDRCGKCFGRRPKSKSGESSDEVAHSAGDKEKPPAPTYAAATMKMNSRLDYDFQQRKNYQYQSRGTDSSDDEEFEVEEDPDPMAHGDTSFGHHQFQEGKIHPGSGAGSASGSPMDMKLPQPKFPSSMRMKDQNRSLGMNWDAWKSAFVFAFFACSFFVYLHSTHLHRLDTQIKELRSQVVALSNALNFTMLKDDLGQLTNPDDWFLNKLNKMTESECRAMKVRCEEVQKEGSKWWKIFPSMWANIYGSDNSTANVTTKNDIGSKKLVKALVNLMNPNAEDISSSMLEAIAAGRSYPV